MAQPFIHLIERVAGEFPGYPPYAGRFDSIVPHLTVAQGATADLLEAERLLSAQLAMSVACRCDALVLIEKSTGRWRENSVFALGRRSSS